MIRPFRLGIHKAPLMSYSAFRPGGSCQLMRARRRRRYFLTWWQVNRCFGCSVHMTRPKFGADAKTDSSFEHIKPKARGGAWADNQILFCRGCNERKGNRAPRACEIMVAQFAGEAWRAWLAT